MTCDNFCVCTTTAETVKALQNSGAGAAAYFKQHQDEKHVLVLEMDGGAWSP